MHEGHRQRMYEKLKNNEELFDHEVLEILLYNVCPRINTNPLAHSLLDRFVTISGVFGARIDELKEVAGVGENVALYLKTVGTCAERAGNIGSAPTLKTLADCKRFITVRLKDRTSEIIEIYFVNKAGRVQRVYGYTADEKSRAKAKINEIARSVTLHRPHGVIIAHNHVDGTTAPSGYDDDFTRIIQFVCNMNGATLLDHIIYCENDFYSYKDNNKLSAHNSDCSWESFEKWIKSIN